TPLLIQLFFMFYVFPEFGVSLSPLTIGIIGLSLYYSAYLSEVFRAGIENIPKAQWEAAKGLGFSPYHLWTKIIFPQAIIQVFPSLGNYVVSIFKETPLLSSITVLELMQTAKIIGADTFRYVEPVTLVGILFL